MRLEEKNRHTHIFLEPETTRKRRQQEPVETGLRQSTSARLLQAKLESEHLSESRARDESGVIPQRLQNRFPP